MRFREVTEIKEVNETVRDIVANIKFVMKESLGDVIGWSQTFLNHHPMVISRFINDVDEDTLKHMLQSALTIGPSLREIIKRLCITDEKMIDGIIQEFREELIAARFILEFLDMQERTKGIYTDAKNDFGVYLTWIEEI